MCPGEGLGYSTFIKKSLGIVLGYFSVATVKYDGSPLKRRCHERDYSRISSISKIMVVPRFLTTFTFIPSIQFS